MWQHSFFFFDRNVFKFLSQFNSLLSVSYFCFIYFVVVLAIEVHLYLSFSYHEKTVVKLLLMKNKLF